VANWIPDLLPNLVLFAGAALLLAMAPGPSTVVVIWQTLRGGRRSAFGATMANELGLLVWALVAALGISSLVAASQVAYDVLRIGGAAVLVVLGVQSLIRARAVPLEVAGGPASESGWKGFRIGLVTILANPKAAVFVFSFLPQFIPEGVPVLPSLLALSLVLVIVDTGWYIFLSWVVARSRRVLIRPRVRQRMEQVSGVVLVALGVRLAVERV
jgi:threonine/homoserine/homoserine lactone efflux protein